MRFDMSNEGKILIIGIMAILIGKLDSRSYDNSPDQLFNFYPRRPDGIPEGLHKSSVYAYEVNTKTPSPVQTTSSASNPPQQVDNQVECVPPTSPFVVDVLSPEILSQSDPMRYLLEKTIETRSIYIRSLEFNVNELLRTRKLSKCYIPYAKALSSLLRHWLNLTMATNNYMLAIRQDKNLAFVRQALKSSLSSELLEIYSPEILDDPTPPMNIFYKLFDMSRGDIKKLKAQLQKFVELKKTIREIPFNIQFYVWYAECVWGFIRNESDFDELKRDMNTIQSMATEGRPPLPAS